MKLAKTTWFEHAAFEIEIASRIFLVDPWLDSHPTSSVKASEITQTDVVYITHDHGDHLGDAFDICKRTKSAFVATFELGTYAEENGVENVVGLNIGGSVEIKGVRLSVTQAFHKASKEHQQGLSSRARTKQSIMLETLRSSEICVSSENSIDLMWL